jgi:thioredoxin-like negative regulator of GroEL
VRVVVLLHFVAPWASAICDPHRREVAEAARALGAEVVEVDYDDDPEPVRTFGVPNIPAVAIEGSPGSLIVGAFPSEVMIERLRPFVT